MDRKSQLPPSAAQAAQMFLRPRAGSTAATLDYLPRARRMRVTTSAGEVAAAIASPMPGAPLVMLVHGWEGRASDMAAFAQPLLAGGCSVLALDLPAHGESSGEQTSIPDAAQALLEVQQALGPLHGVIAHSVGAAVVAEALGLGMRAGRVVLVSAPAHYVDYARGFASATGLDGEGADAMIAALRAMGVDVYAVSLPQRALTLSQPALFIHSRDDRVVPMRDAVESASCWAGARLLAVDGLGHRRILQAPWVVGNAMQFLGVPGSTASETERFSAGLT